MQHEHDNDKNNNERTVEEYTFKDFSASKILKSGESNEYRFTQFRESLRKDGLSQELENAREKGFDISELTLDRRRLNEVKRNEIEDLVRDEVEKKLVLMKDQAREEGFAEGKRLGEEQIKEELSKEMLVKLDSLDQAVQEVLAEQEKFILRNQENLIRIMRDLTKWIVLRELKDDEGYHQRLLEKLIYEIKQKSDLLIKVHPKFIEKMPDIVEMLDKKFGQLPNIRLESSEELTREGIILEGFGLNIDGSLDCQFENLDKIFDKISASLVE